MVSSFLVYLFLNVLLSTLRCGYYAKPQVQSSKRQTNCAYGFLASRLQNRGGTFSTLSLRSCSLRIPRSGSAAMVPQDVPVDMAAVSAEALGTPERAIECAITNPRILNVSDMLAQHNIQALQQSNPTLYKTLEIFAYGTLKDLPQGVNLPPAALRKLQQLSLITLAANSTSNRQLPYADVMQYLGLSSVRELEDIVIDAIYNKLIKARLDSKGQFIEVDDWASRDTPASNIPAIVNVLTEFAQSATDVRQHTLADADRRDAQVTAERKRAQQAEADLIAARKALDESVMATMNSHDPATSSRAKASRSGRQRPGQTTPASK
ncbi:hypothetical protein Y032_0008g279 [Ancylostoma ceylanicum]|uniref:PCI domain-containing protein n=2 Tax=Ancylostoma ceylanicum TaxID=53326 RepID=A0A016VKP3_9BILA|nr:hypothetical protein Y032_0008g279 [Ancylostoma ceylanicum]